MARRHDALGVTGANTIIGTGVTVEGALNAEGDVTVDGKLKGNITSTGDVLLGVNAQVRGAIIGQNVSVAGSLHGDITANGEVTIKATGRVYGDISCLSLAIAGGAFFTGNSRMQTPPQLDPLSRDSELEY